MKLVKGSYFSGYVKMHVTGEQPERFLQLCIQEGIMLWEIRRNDERAYTAMLQLEDIKSIRRLRTGTPYKIRFTKKYGLPFVHKRVRKQKPLLFGILFSALLFFILSNMVWQVTVTGVPEEVENRIHEQLESYGVYPGAIHFRKASPNQIQQQLLEDVPELLWVGVNKKGTSFQLEGVEKLIVTDEEDKSPRHLIALKSGVIKSMYVKRGMPEVRVNDFVEKGDLLVSGSIEKLDMTEPDEEGEEQSQSYELVAAEGDIVATTWYRAEVEIALDHEQTEWTGKSETVYHLQLGSFSFPVWPWRPDAYESQQTETDEHQLNLFGWKPPIYFISEVRRETMPKTTERTKEEAVDAGILQVRKDLQAELGPDAQIVAEKVLHETIDHGKVKLSLYLTVEENIAIEQPINQGD